MNRILKRSKWLYSIAGIFAVGLLALLISFALNADEWVSQTYNKHLATSAGTIYDRNGVVLATTSDDERVYNTDEDIRTATFITVGDAAGYISTGAQTAFKSELLGYNLFNGLYSTDEDGSSSDLQLTIDAQLSVTAYNALVDGGYEKGTIGVYNYQTGEILCAVSLPTYDPNDPPSSEELESDEYEGVYINRFFSGLYTPGSTFKLITSACALENVEDIESRSFTCNGSFTLHRGSEVTCTGVHGTRSFQSMLNHSCNSAFAEIAATLLTNEEMTATATEFGFNTPVSVNGITCATSYFTLEDAYPIDRAWCGIGQYETLINPCHELTIMGAIANRTGRTPTPTLIVGESNSTITYCSADVASDLDDLARSDVSDYYGDSRFPNLSMAGKTGTAEVSGQDPHTLFVGYSQRDDLPLAIIVVLENSGGYGLTNAIPVANTVMQKALDLYT